MTRDLTARRKAEETARALADEQTARAVAEQAEELVRYERERYKALSTRLEVILEGVGDGVTVQDQTGAIVFANSAAARLCGYPSAQALVETSVSDIIGRFEMFDEAGNLFSPDAMPGRKVLRGEPGTRAIARVRERDSGRQWWTAIRAHPVKNTAGEPELAVNVWHDITIEHRRDEHERYVARATATLATSLDYPTMLRALADLLVPGLADWCSIHLVKAGGNQTTSPSRTATLPAWPWRASTPRNSLLCATRREGFQRAPHRPIRALPGHFRRTPSDGGARSRAPSASTRRSA